MQSLDLSGVPVVNKLTTRSPTKSSQPPSPSPSARTKTVMMNGSPPEFDFNMPCRYFKSSFARSLSLNNNNNNNSNNGHNKHQHCKSLEFDINNYRNHNNNNNNTMDINNINVAKTNCLPLPKRFNPKRNEVNCCDDNGAVENEVVVNKIVNEVAKSPATSLPSIPARRTMPSNSNSSNNAIENNFSIRSDIDMQQQSMTQFGSAAAAAASRSGNFKKVINQQQQQFQPHSDTLVAIKNNTITNCRRNHVVWPRESHLQTNSSVGADANKSTKPGLTYEPRPSSAFEVHDNTLNVEAYLLQTQVDTLQWQLKQVETNCEMYRAVMEEVARFFERYNTQQQQRKANHNWNNNKEQIARSKSLYQVYTDEHEQQIKREESPCAHLRPRSSTNLINGANKSIVTESDEHNYETIAPSGSYNAFKDFTWRRSPKKPISDVRTHQSNIDEKLNQEAFRLARTIYNLLNTSMQQPDLTQHRPLLSAARLNKSTPSESVMTLLTPPMHNSTSITLTAPTANIGSLSECGNGSTAATAAPKTQIASEVLFMRASNMRDSRLSLRSSTDGSVHSTISSTASSSSKVETDEESSSTTFHPSTTMSNKPQPHGSSTEDESGFSSINSFQDVGLPLSSTLISNAPIAAHKLENDTPLNSINTDIRNPTLNATATESTATHPNNVVGLPLHNNMPHRWDNPPSKTYRNANKLQRFSTLSNEDSSSAVLWV